MSHQAKSYTNEGIPVRQVMREIMRRFGNILIIVCYVIYGAGAEVGVTGGLHLGWLVGTAARQPGSC